MFFASKSKERIMKRCQVMSDSKFGFNKKFPRWDGFASESKKRNMMPSYFEAKWRDNEMEKEKAVVEIH